MNIGFREAFIAVSFFLLMQFLSLFSAMSYIASLPQIDHPKDIHLEDIHPDHIVPLDPFLSVAARLRAPDSMNVVPLQNFKLPELTTSALLSDQFFESKARWKQLRMAPFLRVNCELWLVNRTLLI